MTRPKSRFCVRTSRLAGVSKSFNHAKKGYRRVEDLSEKTYAPLVSNKERLACAITAHAVLAGLALLPWKQARFSRHYGC